MWKAARAVSQASNTMLITLFWALSFSCTGSAAKLTMIVKQRVQLQSQAAACACRVFKLPVPPCLHGSFSVAAIRARP